MSEVESTIENVVDEVTKTSNTKYYLGIGFLIILILFFLYKKGYLSKREKKTVKIEENKE